MPSSRPLRRLLALLWAFALVVAQLGSAVHLAAVQHEVCAEHGELVDVPRAAPRNATAGDAIAAAPDTHGHEHCSLCALVSAQPSVAQSAPFAPVFHAEGASIPRDVQRRPIAILHLAPKSSPPSSSSLS